MQDGFVPIPRSLYEHEVFDYDDLWKTITWCWRKANFEAGAFRGVAVPVGAFVTGRAVGSDELRCTPSSWYRRMQRLQSMLLIRMEANSEWTMVSVCGYPGCVDASGCSRAAFEQQTSSDRTANEQRLDTIKEFKNLRIKNLPSEDRAADAATPPKASSRKAFEAPTVDQVAAYCRDENLAMDPAAFFDHYAANGWKQSSGRPIVDWKAAARSWARRQEKFNGGQPGTRPAAKPETTDAAAGPLLRITTEEAADPAAFNDWIDRQQSFDLNDGTRRYLHSVRCNTARLFRKPEVARDQLYARLHDRAAGCEIESPSYEDRQQAERDLEAILQPVGGAA